MEGNVPYNGLSVTFLFYFDMVFYPPRWWYCWYDDSCYSFLCQKKKMILAFSRVKMRERERERERDYTSI